MSVVTRESDPNNSSSSQDYSDVYECRFCYEEVPEGECCECCQYETTDEDEDDLHSSEDEDEDEDDEPSVIFVDE